MPLEMSLLQAQPTRLWRRFQLLESRPRLSVASVFRSAWRSIPPATSLLRMPPAPLESLKSIAVQFPVCRSRAPTSVRSVQIARKLSPSRTSAMPPSAFPDQLPGRTPASRPTSCSLTPPRALNRLPHRRSLAAPPASIPPNFCRRPQEYLAAPLRSPTMRSTLLAASRTLC